jgi:hypothetical protein
VVEGASSSSPSVASELAAVVPAFDSDVPPVTAASVPVSKPDEASGSALELTSGPVTADETPGSASEAPAVSATADDTSLPEDTSWPEPAVGSATAGDWALVRAAGRVVVPGGSSVPASEPAAAPGLAFVPALDPVAPADDGLLVPARVPGEASELAASAVAGPVADFSFAVS